VANELAKLNKAARQLAKMTNVQEIKEVRDKAETLRGYAKRIGEGLEVQNQCPEVKVRAERRAGELLKDNPDFGRGKKSATLADFGIDEHQSHRWQLMAAVPENQFDAEIERVKGSGGELTSSHMYRFAKRMNPETEPPEPPTGRYRVLYADPPWKYSDQLTEDYGPAQHHYNPMSIGELCEMPVADWALDDAVLFLWVTSDGLALGGMLVEERGHLAGALDSGRRNAVLGSEFVGGEPSVILTNGCFGCSLTTVSDRLLLSVVPSPHQVFALVSRQTPKNCLVDTPQNAQIGLCCTKSQMTTERGRRMRRSCAESRTRPFLPSGRPFLGWRKTPFSGPLRPHSRAKSARGDSWVGSRPKRRFCDVSCGVFAYR